MASTYNNNARNDQPVTNTYTPLVFSNPDSSVLPSQLSISYFNKVMVISIARRNKGNGAEDFPTYDRDNAIKFYLSYGKAKILHDAIKRLQNETQINNVCIEGNRGTALKVSDGVEFGSKTPVISIVYVANDNEKDGRLLSEICYQTKDSYEFKYNTNINEARAETAKVPSFELDTFLMVLEQYYIANSYALAAVIRDANAYSERYKFDAIKAMMEKMGIKGNSKSNYSSTSVFSNGSTSEAPKEFKAEAFDDIAGSLMGDDFDMSSTIN